jgi:hypothetical protein
MTSSSPCWSARSSPAAPDRGGHAPHRGHRDPTPTLVGASGHVAVGEFSQRATGSVADRPELDVLDGPAQFREAGTNLAGPTDVDLRGVAAVDQAEMHDGLERGRWEPLPRRGGGRPTGGPNMARPSARRWPWNWARTYSGGIRSIAADEWVSVTDAARMLGTPPIAWRTSSPAATSSPPQVPPMTSEPRAHPSNGCEFNGWLQQPLRTPLMVS